MTKPFLTARWEYLVFLNYRCPSALLEPLVPRGTELDHWKGQTLISLVGFHFKDTRVRGFPIPCHRTFEEVNLRFYVRRRDPSGEIRNAVVFIRELVPRRAIAAVARRVYNEPYLALEMSNANDLDPPDRGLLAYFWSIERKKFSLMANIGGPPAEPDAASEAAYITEHYWGYTRQLDGSTLEYRVDHPRWPVWIPRSCSAEGPMQLVFGEPFAEVLRQAPASAFVATGSEVSVFPGQRLESVA